MPERQYIGARYVPKFFENSSTHDSTWAQGVAYEPLTMVTWMSNTYTSKKPVPASVGAPNLNPEYWVVTGIFNAQVDALRTRIDTLEGKFPIQTESLDDGCVTTDKINAALRTRIDTLEGKFPIQTESLDDGCVTADKINKGITIIISDSYGYHPTLTTSWVAVLAKKLGIATDSDTFSMGTRVVNDNLITSIHGSRGFGTDTLAYPATFKDQLSDAIALVDNPDDIVRIIVCGGTNDMAYYNTNKIKTGISAFCTLANSLKNAKTYCGMIGNLLDDTFPTDKYRSVDYLYSLGDYIFMDGLECIMKLRSNIESDNQHPNADGASMIGKAIYNILEAGSIGVWNFNVEEIASFTDGTNTIAIHLDIYFNKNTTNVIIQKYVNDVPKPTGRCFAELNSMAFVDIPANFGLAMGLAPALNSSGDGLTALFRMNQPSTPYKGKLELSFLGAASNVGNFIGQTSMTFDSHYWH